MELFYAISLSFPTVVFSVLLLVVLMYWLLAMFGLLDLDVLNVSMSGDGELELGGVAGLLARWGLDGVPMTLILSVIVFIGWLLSYFADYLLLRLLPFDSLRYLFGAGVLLGASVLAVPLSGLLLHPLKPLFARLRPVSSESLLGRSALVRSPQVTLSQGQAALDDGGAGLILQVRAEPGQFQRGDRVVLVEYIEAQNAYRVIADSQA